MNSFQEAERMRQNNPSVFFSASVAQFIDELIISGFRTRMQQVLEARENLDKRKPE